MKTKRISKTGKSSSPAFAAFGTKSLCFQAKAGWAKARWPSTLDFLIIDSPPGTGDEPLSVVSKTARMMADIIQSITALDEHVTLPTVTCS
jgi:hypothetical protein